MTSIIDKLKIKPGSTLLAINAPSDFRQLLAGLPINVKIVTNGDNHQQVHWFVMNKKQLEKEFPKVLTALHEGIIVWVYYPKGTSGLQTDLTRDKGWECLLSESDKLTWINLVSLNKTWSVFGFRPKTAADRKKEAIPKEREIFKWVDATKKQVRLPDDFATALKIHQQATAFFDSLSFTNKKEYLEWIVSAKRPETRGERIRASIERLQKHWKNPRNI